MKITSRALAALLLAGIAWSAPAQAQGVPQGTYLQSCGNVGMERDTLVAVCLTTDRRAAADLSARGQPLRRRYRQQQRQSPMQLWTVGRAGPRPGMR